MTIHSCDTQYSTKHNYCPTFYALQQYESSPLCATNNSPLLAHCNEVDKRRKSDVRRFTLSTPRAKLATNELVTENVQLLCYTERQCLHSTKTSKFSEISQSRASRVEILLNISQAEVNDSPTIIRTNVWDNLKCINITEETRDQPTSLSGTHFAERHSEVRSPSAAVYKSRLNIHCMTWLMTAGSSDVTDHLLPLPLMLPPYGSENIHITTSYCYCQMIQRH